LIDGAVQLFRANYVPMVTLGAIYYVPLIVLNWTVIGTMRAGTTPAQIVTMYERFGITWPVIIIWTAAWYTVFFTLVSDVYLGRPADIASAMSRGLSRLVPTVLSGILKSFGVLAASLFFFIPGIILALHWFAAPATAVLEPVGPVAALGRSGVLSRGLKWHVFKTYLILFCLFIAAYFVVLVVGYFASLVVHAVSVQATNAVLQLVTSILLIFIYPIWPVTQTLLYYDARIRNEGYDIELMSQSVGAAPASAPAY
jgi:hypothetical protein